MEGARRIKGIAAATIGALLLAGGVCFASAAGEINFFAESETQGPQIRLGEAAKLIGFSQEEREALTQIPLGAAPRPGSELVLTESAIRTRLFAGGVDPDRYSVSIPASVTVRALQTLATGEQIFNGAVEYLQQRLPWDADQVQVTAKKLPQDVSLEYGQLEIAYSITGSVKKFGPIRMHANIYLNGEKKRSVNLSGSIQTFVPVLIAARQIELGDVLSAGDFETAPYDVTELTDFAMTSPEQVAGMTASRQIRKGDPVTAREVKLTPAVMGGEVVDLVVRNGLIQVSMRAKALEVGYIGSSIRVQTETQNRRVLEAMVTDFGKVEINRNQEETN